MEGAESLFTSKQTKILRKIVELEEELLRGVQELGIQLDTLLWVLIMKGIPITPEDLETARAEWMAGREVEGIFNKDLGRALAGLKEVDAALGDLKRSLREDQAQD